MDDDGSLGIRNWGFFETPARNLGLQLMSSVPADRDTKQLLSNSPFLHHHGHQHMPHHPHHHPRDGGVGGGAPSGIAGMPAEAPSMPMNFVRNDLWMHPTHHPRDSKMLHTLNADPRESKMLHTLNVDPRESKMLHTLNVDPHESKMLHTLNADPRESKMLCTLTAGHAGHVAHAAHHEPAGYGMMIPGTHSAHTLQMMQQPEPQPPPPPKQECMSPPLIEENVGVINEPPPPKKRQQRRQPKSPKPKKPKKVAATREDRQPNGPAPRRRVPKKTVGMVINGIDLDLSRIPTPVCSCTGAPQQCYRWGAGGWQSACCTTTVSTYPLPMSTKRRGARIAGRKMSQGAFKKVLEKLAGEGYNLNNPIDLKTLWAKHGTNKFVTIR